jgi:RNA polymerase sigma-70 factor (ECF subfamily)
LFHQPAYALAFRVCQCPQLAQDVTQEAFINAFRRIRQFRGDAPFWGWLRRVVVNQAISALRKLPRLDAVELGENHAVHHGEEARIDLAMDLELAFSQLNAQDRAVVWLHDVEGYSHIEIAALFGMTESFSKTRLSRAHARLRELIDPCVRPGAGGAEPVSSRPRPPSGSRLDGEPATAPPTPLLNLSTSI